MTVVEDADLQALQDAYDAMDDARTKAAEDLAASQDAAAQLAELLDED